MRLRLPVRVIDFPRRPLVMGIVNVNDDSFSGDGTLDFDVAVALARHQAEAGADLIDVGAESARTNRSAIPVAEEIRRLRGFVERWEEIWQGAVPRDGIQIWPPVLSVNTWRPEVVEQILRTGKVEFVNDMGALPDDRNARSCAAHGAALLVMHSVGVPKIPHLQQHWSDVMEARLGKFGRPVLVPVSRKTVIGEVLGLPNPTDRDAGTIACVSVAMARGAAIFRVHQVNAAWQAIRVLSEVQLIKIS